MGLPSALLTVALEFRAAPHYSAPLCGAEWGTSVRTIPHHAAVLVRHAVHRPVLPQLPGGLPPLHRLRGRALGSIGAWAAAGRLAMRWGHLQHAPGSRACPYTASHMLRRRCSPSCDAPCSGDTRALWEELSSLLLPVSAASHPFLPGERNVCAGERDGSGTAARVLSWPCRPRELAEALCLWSDRGRAASRPLPPLQCDDAEKPVKNCDLSAGCSASGERLLCASALRCPACLGCSPNLWPGAKVQLQHVSCTLCTGTAARCGVPSFQELASSARQATGGSAPAACR